MAENNPMYFKKNIPGTTAQAAAEKLAQQQADESNRSMRYGVGGSDCHFPPEVQERLNAEILQRGYKENSR